MGGGLMQLVAYGAQDIYLTGNPQITFFKVVYRRHTNFSMESIQQTINGSSQLTKGNTGTVTISRNGDLVSGTYLRQVGGSRHSIDWTQAILSVELEIGGQRIDRHNREYLEIFNELTTPASKAYGFKSMIGQGGDQGKGGVSNVYIPLRFWFCNNPGLALPLIALQYHEVKLKFSWGNVSHSDTLNVEVWCDYIYLDTDERRRFAQVSHEYLIEQLQVQTEQKIGTSFNLNFNHPVKELIWTTPGAHYFHKSDVLKLQLNGHDRFSNQYPEYFQLKQPMDYHTSVPHQNLPWYARENADTVRAQPDAKTVAAVDNGGDHLATPDSTVSTPVGSTLQTTVGPGTTSGWQNKYHGGKLTFGAPAVTGANDTFTLTDTSDGAGVFTFASGTQAEAPAHPGDWIQLFFDDNNDVIGQYLAHVSSVVKTAHSAAAVSYVWAITLDHGNFAWEEADTDDIITFASIPAAIAQHGYRFLANQKEAVLWNATPSDTQVGFTLTTSVLGVATLVFAATSAVFSEYNIQPGDTLALGHGDGANFATAATIHAATVDTVTVNSGSYDGAANNMVTVVLSGVYPPIANEATTGDTLSCVVLQGRRGTANTSHMHKRINCYSFALKPEEHQPSGTCNFSRIDNAKFICSSTVIHNIYAVNYNVLRIMSGMGGLAYSN